MKILNRLKAFKISRHLRTMLLALLTMMSLTAVLSVGPIYAYLKMTTDPVSNSFALSPYVNPTVAADYSISVGDTRTDNTGNTDHGYSVYVRAAVVATWKNSTGEIYAKQPVLGTDYTIVLGNNWVHSGEYFYYTIPVNSQCSTTPLITSRTVTNNHPEPDITDYTLQLEILAQTVQSEPNSAVLQVWEVNPPTLPQS
ncbi:MAG: hypothetical protein IJM51_06305 [Clostridia bacterium]|nr:hypothetical protein [Clostridia bacterium]